LNFDYCFLSLDFELNVDVEFRFRCNSDGALSSFKTIAANGDLIFAGRETVEREVSLGVGFSDPVRDCNFGAGYQTATRIANSS